MNRFYDKIFIPSKPQPDTIAGIFLLKTFGRDKYPGIEDAAVEAIGDLPQGFTETSLAERGVLLIDVGGGKFDHHGRNTTASRLIAEDLDIAEYPTLAKLLAYAERDDKYGAGTISQDPLDKAFGLSGLIAALAKTIPHAPEKVVGCILPLLKAHYREEKQRLEELPKEFAQKLKTGDAEEFSVKHPRKDITVVMVRSDNPSMAGYLRAAGGIKADLVAQQTASGYVNIMTRPLKRIDLRPLALVLRKEEARRRNRHGELSEFELARPGRIPEIPEWYYDRATNSLLNGGMNPKGISPTAIPFQELKGFLQEGLSAFLFRDQTPRREYATPSSSQYFLEIHVPREAAEKIRSAFHTPPPGVKLHNAENYHITLLHLGECNAEQIQEILPNLEAAIRSVQSFPIVIEGKQFTAGVVPGYPSVSFYFEANGAEGLHMVQKKVQEAVPWSEAQEYVPHLTIATVLPNMSEEVVKNAVLIPQEALRVAFVPRGVQLTEVMRRPDGSLAYKTKRSFAFTQAE